MRLLLGALSLSLSLLACASRERAGGAAEAAVPSADARPATPTEPPSQPPLATVDAAQPSPSPLVRVSAAGCDVAIDLLVEKNVFRGTPRSRMNDDARAADPDYARRDDAESHGSRYLACDYRVRVNGVAYDYRYTAHSGPAIGELDPDLCADPAELRAAAEGIVRFTDGCKDLRRGEYYGDVLVPLDP